MSWCSWNYFPLGGCFLFWGEEEALAAEVEGCWPSWLGVDFWPSGLEVDGWGPLAGEAEVEACGCC